MDYKRFKKTGWNLLRAKSRAARPTLQPRRDTGAGPFFLNTVDGTLLWEPEKQDVAMLPHQQQTATAAHEHKESRDQPLTS
jgi:hypothetical protein